ncbi:hypothetical protein NQ317_016523 [Molorchus minor]|uniref:Sas10 C-terminal domain-containing protein n=1 Tax=Molorchus minor TaxID=1323400 RepID=A0ABQ9IZ95_9CUCU|nr:hypothetical protein NQ317_016523 [Molorchus minor]
MTSHLRFDDMDNYEPSDSDGEYTEKEKQLLKKVRSRKKEYSDSEDEVYGVGQDETDDDDEGGDKSDLALSDVEGQEDDELPDIRAWGRDKRKYYSTDYLDDDDFSLDILTKKIEEGKQTEEIIKTDISKLTKRQKLQLLQKESPEFFGLVDDFQAKMLIAKDYLNPIIERQKKGEIPVCKAVDFVQTQYTLILNYATNIYMYLLLKSSKANVQNHPVIKRLYQYRQLLAQLDPIFEEIIKPQINIILQGQENNDTDAQNKTEKKKTLKLLASYVKKPDQTNKTRKKSVAMMDEQLSKKAKVDKKVTFDDNTIVDNKMEVDPESDSSGEEINENVSDNQSKEEGSGTTKRAITYEMAKNKGLTPYRKKELRNPRVKHRLKYRKAIIRRKGAVREPRTELTRYSGEISGIKASVSKSIKIKT